MKKWLGEDYANEIIPIEIDTYAGWLSEQRFPIDFWRFVFEKIPKDPNLESLIRALRAKQFEIRITGEFL